MWGECARCILEFTPTFSTSYGHLFLFNYHQSIVLFTTSS
jgi:hypothetical protein